MHSFKGHSMGNLFDYLKDPGIISLAGGLPSPDMFPRQAFRLASRKRLKSDIDRIMQYRPIRGEPELMEAIQEFLRRDGISVTEENMIVTSSGQHGLDLASRLFLDPGDAVLVDRPTFSGALIAFQLQNPRIAGSEIQEDGSDVDGFRDQIKKLKDIGVRSKFIYVVPDFQNPSGITMSIKKRRALLDLSYETHTPIVEDSPYRDFRYAGEPLPSLYSMDQQERGGHVIGVYTFSKLFCPGIRVGFNIGPPDVIRKMVEIKEGDIFNTPKYNQDMCAAFLTEMDLERHIEQCRRYYSRKLTAFTEAMKRCFPPESGIRWTEPDGGLFLWVTAPEQVDTMQWLHRAVKRKVAFVPGSVFYGNNPPNNHFRVNFSYASREELTEAVDRLALSFREQTCR
jgi:2-aminoadipate transaminase